MDYDFIVGFTLFYPNGFKTKYKHFDKLEVAKMFASNVNIKNNHKIYVDLNYHLDLLEEIEQKWQDKIKAMLENDLINISGFECFSKGDVQSLLEME